MSDLIDSPVEGENAPEFSVSEISGALKRTIEGAFGRVRVRGEVGRVMLARSGHLYFDVKDDRSVLAAVSWKGQVSRLSIMPEEGMEVVPTPEAKALVEYGIEMNEESEEVEIPFRNPYVSPSSQPLLKLMSSKTSLWILTQVSSIDTIIRVM
mgnify:CR=1 FL=1